MSLSKYAVLLLLVLFAGRICAQVKTLPANEREVTFAGAGGLALHGTLLLPAGAEGKVPGVLLLAGSGQTDRNGNVPGLTIDLLKEIAERLAREGYASLRFDKRAAAVYAASWPADVAKQNDFFSWDSFVGDAKAGLVFLQAQPRIDARRVVIAGHSEGATIAMQIGHDFNGATNAPAGLILISSPGRTGGLIVREQVDMGLKRNGATDEQLRPYLDYVDLVLSQLKKDGTIPPNPPPGLEGLFPPSAAKLLRAEFEFDPARILPGYDGPVLVVQGGKDVQVSALRDTPLLDTALKTRKRGKYEVLIVPSASHNMKKVNNENLEPGLVGPVVTETLDKIAAWMKASFRL